MKRWIFLCMLMLAGCTGTAPSSELQSPQIALHCMIVELDSGFCDRLGLDSNGAPPVLSDIETYFLFDFPKGTKSTPVEFDAGNTVRLADTYGNEDPDRWILASGNILDEKLQLELSSAAESAIRMPKNISVELPRSGSTIFPVSKPDNDNRQTYIWVVNARR